MSAKPRFFRLLNQTVVSFLEPEKFLFCWFAFQLGQFQFKCTGKNVFVSCQLITLGFALSHSGQRFCFCATKLHSFQVFFTAKSLSARFQLVALILGLFQSKQCICFSVAELHFFQFFMALGKRFLPDTANRADFRCITENKVFVANLCCFSVLFHRKQVFFLFTAFYALFGFIAPRKGFLPVCSQSR